MPLPSLKKQSESLVTKALDQILLGKSELNFVESGVSLFINQNMGTEVRPKERVVVASNPAASVLIKKKAFSTFKSTNDLRWLDKTEKMLLRATKALFALKVSQIRSYESLTKLDKFYEETGDFNFALLADLILSSKYLKPPGSSNSSDIISILGNFGVAAGMAASLDDMIKVLRRNAFSTANTRTTWIVDPDDVTNYGTGPGTGVIELCTFTNINTNTGISSDSKGASISILDPYRILNIIEDDIEIAIEEALLGTLGLMNDLAYAGMGGEYIDPVLTVSSAFELGGLGRLDSTIDVDYIRDRLRTFYLGKWAINVNDGVHIFIASNKSVFGNNFEYSQFDKSYLEVDDTILEAERKLYTNQNISKDAYKNIRQYSNDSFVMQHVFGGYVKSVSESYSPDRATLSISCQDNMGWLTNVRFMEEPALIDPKAPLEDPLTPYDLKTISSPETWRRQDLELLPENKYLLKSGLLSFDSGLLNGYNANETNIFQGQYSGPGSAYGSQVIQHPSGLIYRWRTGVLAITSSINPGGSTQGSIPGALAPTSRQNYGFSVANSVVSNLDVANVISVMVTGQPYNLETFTQQAVDAMNGYRKSGSFSPNDALSFVLDSIKKQNPFYGNFKPFRIITMSDQTIGRLSGDAFTNEENKTKVSILRKRKNEILKKRRVIEAADDKKNNNLIGLLNEEIKLIDGTIDDIVFSTYKSSSAVSGPGINAEDFLNANFNIFGANKALKLNGNLESDGDLSRAMMKVATMRRIEDVKLNRDQNLLIVSDQYDINPDIKAYILSLRTSGFKLFQGNYLDVYQRCTEAAKITMMEFFCNTQGHLEIRPPQYNKTPLSVLNALYEYQNTTNKKIVPDFLFKMFEDRISSLKLEIHYLNIRICILAMMLGKYPDSNLIPGVPFSGKSSLVFFGMKQKDDRKTNISSFSLNERTNTLIDTSNFDLKLNLGSKEDGDILTGNTDIPIGNFDEIVAEFKVGSTSIYDSTLDSLLNANKEISRFTPNEDLVVGNTPVTSPSSPYGTGSNTAKIINEMTDVFREETGYNPGAGLPQSGDKFEQSDILFDFAKVNSSLSDNINRVQSRLDFVFTELSRSISKRNSLITTLNRNKEKEKELQQIQDSLLSGFSEQNDGLLNDQNVENFLGASADAASGDGWKGYQKAAFDTYQAGKYVKNAAKATRKFLTGTANKGSLFDHLIDDDTRNLLGPGSGRRFIIYDEQIKSYDIKERDPEVTRIDIFGTTPLVNEQMKQVTGGENYIQWAGAVDYDLWRQYGYKHRAIQDAPFISDAETQAKPLALQHLAMQRVIIFSGSIQLAGNEFYQPGDTVYIPSKGLLFYVNSVTHTFTYGSSFDTSLELINGHAPGVYLPTPVDIIGQSYSKDTMKQGAYFVKRSDTSDSNYKPLQPDCTITFPTLPKITKNNVEYLLSHKNNMVKFYNMITDISNGILTPNRVLLIRGFIRDESEKSEVIDKMSIISELFQNPVVLSQKANTSVGDDLLAEFLSPAQDIFNINATSGMNKELKTLFLPNGVPVTKVTKQQIVCQLVNLKRESGEKDKSANFSIIQSAPANCFSILDAQGAYSVRSSGGDDYKKFKFDQTILSDFPRGGPSQSAWLEMSDLLQSIYSGITGDYEKVIEIGILELDTNKVKLLMSFK